MIITKTIKIAMKELIDENYYVILLDNEVFDIVATNERKLRFIKTIFTDVETFNIIKQKDRINKFFKYPQFNDDEMLVKNKCFSKELWIRSKDNWVSKITIS